VGALTGVATVLSETVIALTVNFEDIPRVVPRERIELAKLNEGFWQIIVHLGFVQVPDIPAALRQAKDCGCPIDLEDAIYFGGRDTVVCSNHKMRTSGATFHATPCVCRVRRPF
jgi:KUP system potassium uptake protein